MIVRLVRHGRAGRKRDWKADDRLRPLDDVGRRQAEAIAELLGPEPPAALLSSPTTRCVQTLEPLAGSWATAVTTDDALAKEAGTGDLLRLLRHAEDGDVLCTHGEVMSALLERLRFGRTELLTGERDVLSKGTLWELTLKQGKIRRLRHVDPAAARAR